MWLINNAQTPHTQLRSQRPPVSRMEARRASQRLANLKVAPSLVGVGDGGACSFFSHPVMCVSESACEGLVRVLVRAHGASALNKVTGIQPRPVPKAERALLRGDGSVGGHPPRACAPLLLSLHCEGVCVLGGRLCFDRSDPHQSQR